jgi:pyruvate kinase
MSANIIRQLNTTRGVTSLKIPSYIGTDNLINDAIKYSLESNYIKKGDKVICLMGQNEETPEYVNVMKVSIV